MSTSREQFNEIQARREAIAERLKLSKALLSQIDLEKSQSRIKFTVNSEELVKEIATLEEHLKEVEEDNLLDEISRAEQAYLTVLVDIIQNEKTVEALKKGLVGFINSVAKEQLAGYDLPQLLQVVDSNLVNKKNIQAYENLLDLPLSIDGNKSKTFRDYIGYAGGSAALTPSGKKAYDIVTIESKTQAAAKEYADALYVQRMEQLETTVNQLDAQVASLDVKIKQYEIKLKFETSAFHEKGLKTIAALKTELVEINAQSKTNAGTTNAIAQLKTEIADIFAQVDDEKDSQKAEEGARKIEEKLAEMSRLSEQLSQEYVEKIPGVKERLQAASEQFGETDDTAKLGKMIGTLEKRAKKKCQT